jgi:hypothetical protein
MHLKTLCGKNTRRNQHECFNQLEHNKTFLNAFVLLASRIFVVQSFQNAFYALIMMVWDFF